MQVGDLVKFKDNSRLGLIIAYKDEYFHIHWVDGFFGIRFEHELEVISEGR